MINSMAKEDLKLLQLNVVRISRVHFYFALALATQIIFYDAWRLIQPEAVLSRWAATALLFVTSTVVWLFAKSPKRTHNLYRNLIIALVVVDVLFVSYFIYQTRGMASRAVMLYALPIIVSSILHSRVALIGTAFFSIAAYTTTAIAYFTNMFNEGYTIELYGEVGFYSAFMLILAMSLWAVQNKSLKDG